MTHVEVAVYEDVLILDIAVSDTLTVEVVDGFDDLREYKTCLVLRKALVLRLFDAFKEIVRRSAHVGPSFSIRLRGFKIRWTRFSRKENKVLR